MQGKFWGRNKSGDTSIGMEKIEGDIPKCANNEEKN